MDSAKNLFFNSNMHNTDDEHIHSSQLRSFEYGFDMSNMAYLSEGYMPMLLMNSEIPQGGFREHIASISDPNVKEMALAEYYYFSGRPEKAAPILEKYLHHHNPYFKLTAWLLYSFSNLALSKIGEVRRGIKYVYEFLESDWQNIENVNIKALLVLVANSANVLIDLQIKGVPPIDDYIRFLPPGLRLLGCYIMAHKAYLDGEYGKGLGIVETCFAFFGERYIICDIYLSLAGAMNAMSLGNVKKGKEFFKRAYALAEADELFEPLGEHHGLLQGLVETCLKKDEKDIYDRIIEITYKFSYGWRCIHNPLTQENIADTLTTTEFTIAMLANRGWTNNRIAEYMGINVNTVKSHIASVFDKLNINNRKELKAYMLK